MISCAPPWDPATQAGPWWEWEQAKRAMSVAVYNHYRRILSGPLHTETTHRKSHVELAGL